MKKIIALATVLATKEVAAGKKSKLDSAAIIEKIETLLKKQNLRVEKKERAGEASFTVSGRKMSARSVTGSVVEALEDAGFGIDDSNEDKIKILRGSATGGAGVLGFITAKGNEVIIEISIDD